MQIIKRPGQIEEKRAKWSDVLKVVPNREKQERHLEQMLEIFRMSPRQRNIDSVQLEDGELAQVAAAGRGTSEPLKRCPFCGVELPMSGLAEHQREKHGI